MKLSATLRSTVALEMVSDNEVARRFYEQEGFTTTFVRMHRSLADDGSLGQRRLP